MVEYSFVHSIFNSRKLNKILLINYINIISYGKIIEIFNLI